MATSSEVKAAIIKVAGEWAILPIKLNPPNKKIRLPTIIKNFREAYEAISDYIGVT